MSSRPTADGLNAESVLELTRGKAAALLARVAVQQDELSSGGGREALAGVAAAARDVLAALEAAGVKAQE